jgi:hypothetical protein
MPCSRLCASPLVSDQSLREVTDHSLQVPEPAYGSGYVCDQGVMLSGQIGCG